MTENQRKDTHSSTDSRPVTVTRVVVPGVELVNHQGSPFPTEVLDLGKLGVGHDPASGIARVGGQNDTGAASNLLGDLVGVEMVAFFL